MTVAARAGGPPFHVMRVMAAAGARRAAGQRVLDLSVGQPLTPAPATVRAAARNALGAERLGYTPALGIDPLRAAVAGHYADRYGLDVDPAQVAMTTGSSGGVLLALLAAFDAGDEVIVPRPGYPAYRNLAEALGLRVTEVATGAGCSLTAAHLERAVSESGRVPAGVIVGGPANPTGTMADATGLAGITRWCATHGVRLISDEIYHGITYRNRAPSAWESGRDAVVVGSFSKYFSMTGWRLGWLLLPSELVDPVDRLAGNAALCPPVLSQHAALAAFDAYPELDANVARYAANRDLLLRRLPEFGLDRIAPIDGAFYAWVDVGAWTADSLEWSFRLLDETGVAVAPGVDFDPVDGGRFVRLCFAGDADELAEALITIGDWLTG